MRPPPSSGPIERDFEAYYAAGATVNAGGDPYSRAIWEAEKRIAGVDAGRDELLPFVGPPAGLPFWALLARLPYGAAVAVWTPLLVVAALVLLVAALAIAGTRRDPWRIACAAAAAIASAPIISSLALGQTALVGAAAVGAAIVAYRVRAPGTATGATLIAAVQPNLAIALVARIRSRWDAAIAAAACAVFVAVTLVVTGLGGARAYLEHLAAHGRAEASIAIQYTPAAIGYAFGLTPAAATKAGTVVAVIAIALALTVTVRRRLDPTTATLLACSVLPLAIPFFHQQDFAIVVVPLLVLALRARGTTRGLASVAAILVLVDWFGLAQRTAAQGQIMCLGAAVAAGFAGTGPAPAWRWPHLAGLATLVALAAVAVPLARAHPAPTWPEMLPARYRAIPAAPDSAVWAGEQRATGLAQRDPVWGLLRSFPLCGCVVLACALVSDARSRAERRPAPR